MVASRKPAARKTTVDNRNKTPQHEGVSVSWLSDEFDIQRHTIRKRLQDAAIEPSGLCSRGNKVYRVATVAHLFCNSGASDDWATVDPDTLEPLHQQQYWNAKKTQVQTSRERDALLKERRQLLEYEQVEYGIAAMLRQLREGMNVLPDVMDAEVGLSLKQRAAMEAQVDLFLANLSQSVANITLEEDAEGVELPAD